MEKFKEGDLIEMNSNCSGCKIGCQYTLHKGNRGGDYKDRLYAWNNNDINMGNGGCSCQEKWKKIKEQSKNFKIGDRVKIIKYINSNGKEVKDHPNIGLEAVITQISVNGTEFPYIIQTKGIGSNVCDEEIELITNKMPKINWDCDKFVINCKTRKEWENVVKTAEDNGWTYYKYRSPNNSYLWNSHHENSCIAISGIDSGGYCYKEYFNSSDFNGYIHISATEFINEYNINNNNNQIPDEKPNKQGLKTMLRKLSTMLELQLDKESKTLYKAGFINGDLELTQEGKEVNEAINFSKNKTELVKAAEEKIKEEEKSK